MAEPLRFYTSPVHEPFLWPAGETAALLVHGFPGSPREVRALAQPLHDSGWTVQGIRLPGFADELDVLHTVTNGDWLKAVEDALHALRRDYAKVLLVGNSMGAALALQVAAASPDEVAGLILFAPFWRVNSRVLDGIFPVFAPLIPNLRPFARADFSKPEVREAVRSFAEETDLDDPDVQQQVRALTLPVGALSQVRIVGQRGYEAAPRVKAPVLICAGARDVLAAPATTRQLAARLPALAGYIEVDADHELAHMRNPAEHALLPLLADFAQGIAEGRFKTTP